jgi:two-component system phosphate regulon response regulator PhoB
MARIVSIEDEPALQRVLDYNLRQAGHEVLCAMAGGEGLRLVRESHADLVLLDLMLPDIPGMDVVRALRTDPKTRDIPIVIVTARGDEVDRVVGFELGAADYVVKPFSVRELVLRVNAVLRRSLGTSQPVTLPEVGALRIAPEAHRVWVDGKEIELTLLEFKLLLSLFENKERVLSRSALLESVWGIDVTITTRTVDTHVKRLRDKLGSAGSYIQTVRGIGYRFSEHEAASIDERPSTMPPGQLEGQRSSKAR